MLLTPGIISALLNSFINFWRVIPFRHIFFGFSLTIVSIIPTGAGSVADSALPNFPTTCSTSGNDFKTTSCFFMMSITVVREAPGRRTGINSKSPSFKGGMNSLFILERGR
ncbi:hypothetical protein ES703_112839 [subsurface metagenome]